MGDEMRDTGTAFLLALSSVSGADSGQFILAPTELPERPEAG